MRQSRTGNSYAHCSRRESSPCCSACSLPPPCLGTPCVLTAACALYQCAVKQLQDLPCPAHQAHLGREEGAQSPARASPSKPATVRGRGPDSVAARTSSSGQAVAGSRAPTFDRARGNQAQRSLRPRIPVSWRLLDSTALKGDARRNGGRFHRGSACPRGVA